MGGQSPVRHSSAHTGGRASLQPGTSIPRGLACASGSSPVPVSTADCAWAARLPGEQK